MKKFIEVKNITKKFGNKVANDSISFSIGKGEKIGLIGANGAGKTTLVEQIIGTSKPTSGKIEYLFEYKKTPQEKMGMQFQESSYPMGISVKDVIEFTLSIYGNDLDQKKVNKIIEVFQMQEFITAKAKGLSGGQQQKLNVLLAVLHNPELVILDEISTGLDISAREEILAYVEEVIKENNMTTLLISHHMSEIERLCERVIILVDGKVYEDTTIKNILKNSKSLDEYMRNIIGGKHANN